MTTPDPPFRLAGPEVVWAPRAVAQALAIRDELAAIAQPRGRQFAYQLGLRLQRAAVDPMLGTPRRLKGFGIVRQLTVLDATVTFRRAPEGVRVLAVRRLSLV